MRFFMMVKCDADFEAGKPPSRELMDNMDAYMAKTAQSGVLVSAEGLKPSFAGARLQARAGKTAVIDGPFAEAKELIGGYAIVNAGSLAEAIEMAKEFVEVHIRSGVPDVDVEIRQMYDAPPTPAN